MGEESQALGFGMELGRGSWNGEALMGKDRTGCLWGEHISMIPLSPSVTVIWAAGRWMACRVPVICNLDDSAAPKSTVTAGLVTLLVPVGGPCCH